jgi:hypothetical protein
MSANTKQPVIFQGTFSGKWYVSWQYSPLNNGQFIVTGDKYDVTDQIERIIAQHAPPVAEMVARPNGADDPEIPHYTKDGGRI